MNKALNLSKIELKFSKTRILGLKRANFKTLLQGEFKFKRFYSALTRFFALAPSFRLL